MDMELENKNEEAEDHAHSPTKSQSAEENSKAQIAEQDKEEAEATVESAEKLDSADGKMIVEGETPVKEETSGVQVGEEKNGETENVVETSSKADTSNGAPKRLRARAKVVKKSPAGRSVKTRKALLTTEVPVESSTNMQSADDPMIDVKSLEGETTAPEIDEEKNEEAESHVEASPTVEPLKKTPASLRARPKVVTKASAGNSMKANSAIDSPATGTKQLKKKLVKKKIVRVVKKGSGGNENGVAKSLSASEDGQKDTEDVQKDTEDVQKDTEDVQKDTEDVQKDTEDVQKDTEDVQKDTEDVQKDIDDNEPTEKDQVTPNDDQQVIGESSKAQENQVDNGKQTGQRRRIWKRKRKTDGGAVSQIGQKKNRLDSNDAANQGEKGKDPLSAEDKNQKDEKRKGKMDSNSKDKNHRDESNKKKEIADDKGNSARDSKGERLGGLIFMCNSKTKPDCFNYHVMGVPNGKKDLVLNIKPGLKLFLFDFDLRLMYGIYEASSAGGMKLEPKAFGGAFPYQVRFKVYKDCVPLPESTFKKAIKENYNKKNKFDFELTALQVRKLTALFRPADFSPSQSKPLLSRPATAATQDREPRSGGGGRREQRGSDRGGRREIQRHRPGRDGSGKTKGRREQRPVHRREREQQQPSPGRNRELLLRPAHRVEPRREPDLYMSEREYRAYGLQADRRNLTPPRRSNLEQQPYYKDHEIDRALGRQLEPPPNYRDLGRQVEPPPNYRDHPLAVGREVDHPLYYPRHQQDVAGRSELHYRGAPPAVQTSIRSPPASALEPYLRDRYYPYGYGAPSSTSDTYLSNLRRDVSSSIYDRRETYLDETDSLRARDRERNTGGRADHLHSAYAPDPRDARYYPEAHPEANTAAPVSSRYSFAGPSYTYR